MRREGPEERRFRLISSSGTRRQAERLLKQLNAAAPTAYRFEDVQNLDLVGSLLESEPELQIAFIRATIASIRKLAGRFGGPSGINYHLINLINEHGYPLAALNVTRRLLRRELPFSVEDVVAMARDTGAVGQLGLFAFPHLEVLVSKIERFVEVEGLSPALRDALIAMADALGYLANAPETRLRTRIGKMLDGPASTPIEPGEAWSDRSIADLESMSAEERRSWLSIIEHCRKASGGRPGRKWVDQAAALLAEVGAPQLIARVSVWFPLVDLPRTHVIEEWSQYHPDPNRLIGESNGDILKGLVWFASLCEGRELARTLSDLAVSAYRKLPMLGPRSVKIGNASIYALGAMAGTDGVGRLAILKVKVRAKSAAKGIEKALQAAAERLSVPAEEIEEIAVPSHGLTEVGLMRRSLGEWEAVLRVSGPRGAELAWLKPDGRHQKSIPTAVKESHPEELAELKASLRDIRKMLPAQRERLDRLFVQAKSWPFETWRERYLDHPLVGILARRLIWSFEGDGRSFDGIHHEGRVVDSAGVPLEVDLTHATVRLWHPIEHTTEEILSWRRWLERHEVQQPFKQAHREVYYLTDAERNTRTYSNRYAAHIVRQHQFNSLCAARGWHNMLKLMVDGDFRPPELKLPTWDLRVEFWTEGVGDRYAVDTNETGTFFYLTTDQVRFLPLGERSGRERPDGSDRPEPLPLERIPSLVFSEVMRDVDLFVGVASVGNDPTWFDGGPEGRFFDYWHSYSFGELSGSAETRKQVLSELIPRLKIAERCAIEGRFLVVEGSIRTYKIHLGSGNILMSPNDEYLCIVPSGAQAPARPGLFLPFEGDNTLSIIVSKATMLADDATITDPTIVRQIKR